MTYSLLQTVTYTLLARWEDQLSKTTAFFLYVDNLCNPVIKPHNDNLDDDHSQGGNNFDPHQIDHDHHHHVNHHNHIDHPPHVDYHLHHPQGVSHPNQEVGQGAQNLSHLLMFDVLFQLRRFLSDVTCYCSSWECFCSILHGIVPVGHVPLIASLSRHSSLGGSLHLC